MHDMSLPKAYHCLGIDLNADRQDVEKSYRRMKALYSEEALATYGLFGSEERTELLEELETAYERITRTTDNDPGMKENRDDQTLSIPPLDDVSSPAEYLRRAREMRKISLKEIATQTKIGIRHLTMIEEERFEALPAPVYLRGFVFDFARTVGVPEPEEVAKRYIEYCKGELKQEG